MKNKISALINNALRTYGIDTASFVVEHPMDIAHGDFATNAAMVAAKKAGKSPREIADAIAQHISEAHDPDIRSVEVAGPGFVNVFLNDEYFSKELAVAIESGSRYGTHALNVGKKVIIEYTDPNPFKEFHIGHLMSNTIGEAISRIVESSGAEVARACYQGDVGIHVASAVWGMMQEDLPGDDEPLIAKAKYLGRAYARGATAAKTDMVVHDAIIALNRKIYDRTDPKINQLYDIGRSWSLEYFETIYKRLGTQYGKDGRAFDYYFFESETGRFGKQIVEDNLGRVFEKSDSAVVYKGDEAKGLHTRVFINKEGIPTYEAKELGLAKVKYDTYAYDESIVITANEVNDYFRVLLAAMGEVFPDLAAKTVHLSHGILRLPSGKMSSRTGQVITTEILLSDVLERAREKIKDPSFSSEQKESVAEAVAIGATKYSILRQASGKDIIFDFEQSLSFEGDSGPYLQYTYARTRSLLEKAKGRSIDPLVEHAETLSLHKYLLRFPEITARAIEEREPHHIATYLIDIAREFNTFYGKTMIIDGAPDEPYKLALATGVSCVLENGLRLLGIPTPDKM